MYYSYEKGASELRSLLNTNVQECNAHRARKFKKVQAKKPREIKYCHFFREIAFLAVLNFFQFKN